MTLGATYIGGRVVLDDQWQYAKQLTQMGLVEGEALAVQIDRYDEARSKQANAYYWGVVLKAMAEHTGHSAWALHEYCKQTFNAEHIQVNGEEVTVGKSTARLTRQEFFDYVERVRQFAADTLDLVTPDPDPLWQFRPTRTTGAAQHAES